MKRGDIVCFTAEVVKRSGHNAIIANMRGAVVEMISAGKVARVNCRGTYDRDDGQQIRSIPTRNLSVIKNGQLPISATEPDYSDMAYEDQCRDMCGL